MFPTSNGMNKTIIYGTIAVVLLAGLGWYVWVKQSTAPEGVTAPLDTSAPLRVGENAVFISDQLPSNNVTVNMVMLKDPGFIAIHETANGNPGAIIGTSTMLPAGESKSVIIHLTRISKNGEELFAMLHADNGDRVWTPSNDTPIKDAQGNIIMMKFKILNDASAPEEVKL